MSTAFYIALVLSTLAGAAALWHGIPPKKVRALVIFVFLAAAVVQGVVFSLGERRVIRDALLRAIPAIRVPPPQLANGKPTIELESGSARLSFSGPYEGPIEVLSLSGLKTTVTPMPESSNFWAGLASHMMWGQLRAYMRLSETQAEISFDLKPRRGDVIAVITDNRISCIDCDDANWTESDSAIEIKHRGLVALQVRATDRGIHVQGRFFDGEGRGSVVYDVPEGGAIQSVGSGTNESDIKVIKPMFKYPGTEHRGELAKD
jgi:hypothetical protein